MAAVMSRENHSIGSFFIVLTHWPRQHAVLDIKTLSAGSTVISLWDPRSQIQVKCSERDFNL